MANRDDDSTLLLALALLAAASGPEPEVLELLYDRLRHRLLRTEQWDPDLDIVLRELVRAPRRTSRRRTEETREVATAVVEGFRRSFEPSLKERLSEIEGSLWEVSAECKRLGTEVDEGRQRATQLASDLHSYLWLASTGADFASARIARYVPVRVYVGDPVPDAAKLGRIVEALKELGDAIELEPAEELPEESGSWFKRLFLKTKTIASHKEVQDGLAKAKAAVETTYLDKPQAEVTGLLADAAAKVITALSAVPGPCCGQAGSLLVVKQVSSNGSASMVFKTLTPMELKRLEENAAMLQRPADILGWLESMSAVGDDPKISSRGQPPRQLGHAADWPDDEPQ